MREREQAASLPQQSPPPVQVCRLRGGDGVMEEKTQAIQIYRDRESTYASPVAIRHNCSACRRTRLVASSPSPFPVSGRRVRVLRPACLLTFHLFRGVAFFVEEYCVRDPANTNFA